MLRVAGALGLFEDFVDGRRDRQRMVQCFGHAQCQPKVLLHVRQRLVRGKIALYDNCNGGFGGPVVVGVCVCVVYCMCERRKNAFEIKEINNFVDIKYAGLA